MGSPCTQDMHNPYMEGRTMTDQTTVTNNGNSDTQDVLSPRQREVYDMHKMGMKNTEIAAQLGIAAGTVSNALVAAKTRLGEVDSTDIGDMDITQVMNLRTQKIKDRITQIDEERDQLVNELTKIGQVLDALGDEPSV